uniref:CX domain-containing protein n=1 Tax=Panagrellus redivivus TaxID=6233 RepID=A0A7E4VLZ8_PANRE
MLVTYSFHYLLPRIHLPRLCMLSKLSHPSSNNHDIPLWDVAIQRPFFTHKCSNACPYVFGYFRDIDMANNDNVPVVYEGRKYYKRYGVTILLSIIACIVYQIMLVVFLAIPYTY